MSAPAATPAGSQAPQADLLPRRVPPAASAHPVPEEGVTPPRVRTPAPKRVTPPRVRTPARGGDPRPRVRTPHVASRSVLQEARGRQEGCACVDPASSFCVVTQRM